MKVKIKKLHPEAVVPAYGKPGDAGMDLTAVSLEINNEGQLIYDTGLAFEIPQGYFGMVTLRSSVFEKDIQLTNHVGIVDSGYRGSVKLKFEVSQPLSDIAYEHEDYQSDLEKGELLCYLSETMAYYKIPQPCKIYKVGDRIGQLIILPYPNIEFEEAEELSETERGINGYGSTGL